MSLGESERIRRTLGAAWLELFTVRDLFGTEPLLPVNRCPTRSSVPAAQELLVDAFVAGAAIARSQVRADDKAVVIDLLLSGTRLMAVKTVDAFLCMCGHLVLMDHGVLEPRMTLGALAGGTNKIRGWLGGFDARPLPIDEKSGQNERKSNDNSEEHGTKGHWAELQREGGAKSILQRLTEQDGMVEL